MEGVRRRLTRARNVRFIAYFSREQFSERRRAELVQHTKRRNCDAR
jgi:hypothetical protein